MCLEALEKKRRLSRSEGIDAVMDQYELDTVVAPSDGPGWTTDCVNGDGMKWPQLQQQAT